MLFAAAPMLALAVLGLRFLPESPSWLVAAGREPPASAAPRAADARRGRSRVDDSRDHRREEVGDRDRDGGGEPDAGGAEGEAGEEARGAAARDGGPAIKGEGGSSEIA